MLGTVLFIYEKILKYTAFSLHVLCRVCKKRSRILRILFGLMREDARAGWRYLRSCELQNLNYSQILLR
jgi:hypothetical protein